VFYLAQFFLVARLVGAGNETHWQRALNCYRERINLGGWEQEVYVSYLWAGRISEVLGFPYEALAMYEKAYGLCTNRAEAYYAAAKCYRSLGEWWDAYQLAGMGDGFKKPNPNSVLFMESDAFDWRCKDELAVACYFLENYDMAVWHNKALLERDDLPELDRRRIEANLKFSEAELVKTNAL